MAAVQALAPLHEAIYNGKGKPYFLEWQEGQMDYFAALSRNSFSWPGKMIVQNLYAKIRLDPSHTQLISLIAVAYTTHDDNPDAFIRKVYTHIQTFKLEVNAVSKYSRASQLDTARQDGSSLTFQGINLSAYANDRGMISIPNNIYMDYRKNKPKLESSIGS